MPGAKKTAPTFPDPPLCGPRSATGEIAFELLLSRPHLPLQPLDQIEQRIDQLHADYTGVVANGGDDLALLYLSRVACRAK